MARRTLLARAGFGLLLACSLVACSDGAVVDDGSGVIDVIGVDPGLDVGGEPTAGPADGGPGDASDADAAGPEDVPPKTGALGDPCDDGGDCFSGFCVTSHQGDVCTRLCDSPCPDGWTCEQYLGGGSDLVYVCLPRFASLCFPCQENKDCVINATASGARCLDRGDDGAFCGGACDDTECPEGYACVDAPDVDGVSSAQCIPKAGGSCSCSPPAIDRAATTDCLRSNAWGTCGGTRSCAPGGLTACSAPLPEAEACGDALDQDCDGQTDEEDAAGCVVYHADEDGDGWGTEYDLRCLCQAEPPWDAEVGGDCADDVIEVHPEAEELCDGVDQDCDGATDEGFPDADEDGVPDCVDDDSDGDGQPDLTDCAPDDPLIHDGAFEACDGVDNNCNQIVDEGYADTDADGAADCVDPDDDDDQALDDDDCAPLDEAVHPAAEEVCNGIDDDCDGETDEGSLDSDEDGAADCIDDDDDDDGSPDVADCAPLDPDVHPQAIEACDGDDDNCNQLVDEGWPNADADAMADCVDPDDDGDGSDDVDDCAPLDPTVHPGASEVCDGDDEDCDGVADEGWPDLDEDGVADCVDGDLDGDDVLDGEDNCPTVPNPDQADLDGDDLGDACDDDVDGDGAKDAADCEPLDPGVHPGATEVCDGVDDDCDGLTDEGFGDLDADGVADCLDPDDDGDGVDDEADNCPVTPNGEQEDLDDDGVGDACEGDLDGDGDPDQTDCQPTDEDIHHGALEVCDGADQNCNGIFDEGYPDTDQDGLADCVDVDDDGDGVDDGVDNCPDTKNPSQLDSDGDGDGNACDQDDDDDGTLDELDCAPLDPGIHAGVIEACNGVDDDCDGTTDEDNADGCDAYYLNSDGDSFGIELAWKCLCAPAAPYTATAIGDCNDSNPTVFPQATETCNGLDDDCDDTVDEQGASGCILLFGDGDFDGFGDAQACVCPGTPGWALQGGDCDDLDSSVNPGKAELCGDDVDNECDGDTDEPGAVGCIDYYYDEDEDGFGLITSKLCLCAPEVPWSALQFGDCDDDDGGVFPTSIEVCDLVDNNCNGQVDEGVKSTFFKDNDGDDFGGPTTASACEPPDGFVADAGDCNDFNPAIFPGAPELCNEVDDDCNGPADDGLETQSVYKDNDGDGFAAASAVVQLTCDVPFGWTTAQDHDEDGTPDWDCDDSDVTIYPGAPGICDDDKDNDCDGFVDRLCFTDCPGAWPFQQDYPSSAVVMRGDLNGDGNSETVVRTSFGFAILDHFGEALYDFSEPTYNYARADGVFGDVDDWDQKGAAPQTLEVLTGNGSIPRIYALKAGGAVTVYEDPTEYLYDASKFMAADLDFDGQPEFISTTWCELDAVRIYRFDRDTGEIPLAGSIADPDGVCDYTDGRVLTDLDGDGWHEIVFGNGWSDPTQLALWKGNIYAYRFTDPFALTHEPFCDPAGCFPTAIDGLIGGSVPTMWRVGDELRAQVVMFETANPTGENPASSFYWRYDLDGQPIGDQPTATSTLYSEITDVDDDGVPESVSDVVEVGLFDLDGDGYPDRVRRTGVQLRLDLWDPKAGTFIEHIPARKVLGTANLNRPAVWDIDGDGRVEVVAGDAGGRVHCQQLGEQTWHKRSSLPPHLTPVHRTHQWDNFEPNDGADLDGDGFPDRVATIASALTAKGEFYSYLSTEDDVDFLRIDAAWGGHICLESPPNRTYSLRVYSFSDKWTNPTHELGADGLRDGLIYEDLGPAHDKCFNGSIVYPTRKGEYHFVIEIRSDVGDWSPHWPYWIHAAK